MRANHKSGFIPVEIMIVVVIIEVHRFTVSNKQLLKFDQDYDDGSLSTGVYRKLAGDRYYYVVAE